MANRKPKRKRDKVVAIRMSKDEYAAFLNKVDDSGLTQQAFILSAINGTTITPSDEIAVQKEISKTFSNLVSQLRGLATNVNQMAHVANGQGILPTTKQLIETSVEINDYRKECEELWQSIRSSINRQNHTEQ